MSKLRMQTDLWDASSAKDGTVAANAAAAAKRPRANAFFIVSSQGIGTDISTDYNALSA
jgi:hypothetical protein